MNFSVSGPVISHAKDQSDTTCNLIEFKTDEMSMASKNSSDLCLDKVNPTSNNELNNKKC